MQNCDMSSSLRVGFAIVCRHIPFTGVGTSFAFGSISHFDNLSCFSSLPEIKYLLFLKYKIPTVIALSIVSALTLQVHTDTFYRYHLKIVQGSITSSSTGTVSFSNVTN